jgi:hypothetical protein
VPDVPEPHHPEAPVITTLEYVSTLVRPFSRAETDQLLASSRVRNAAAGVTGMLVFRGQRAMQLLEGEDADVRALYRRIAEDPRHRDVVRVWESVHDQRRFPDWAMQFDDLSTPADHVTDDPTWLEVDLPALADSGDAPPLRRSRDHVRRRAAVLRRALASGDRLTTALAIILHGHRPEAVLDGDTVARLYCAECRHDPSPTGQGYPCSTAENAIWALEAAGPRPLF